MTDYYDQEGMEEQYDVRTGRYVKDLGSFRDMERVQKEVRRKRIYTVTTVAEGKIKNLLDNIERQAFKRATISEIYDNDIDNIIDELESELPNFSGVAEELLSIDLKRYPFIYYTNPKLFVLGLYYNRFCKSQVCFEFSDYLRKNSITKFDICRYSMYIDKILKNKKYDGPVYDKTERVNNFLEAYRSFKIEDEIGKDKITLGSKFPDIYMSGYPRFCQYQPSIINEKDKDNYKNYLEFPEGNFLACEHKKLPYIGMKDNYLDNNEEYPQLPCCYSKLKKEKDEETVTIDPLKPVGNKSIYSISDEPRFGYLPEDLNLVFKLFDINIFYKDIVYLRQSVDKSPISSLLCLTTIFEDVLLDEALEKIKKLVKSNYGSTTFINSNNIDFLIDNEEFLDAEQLLPIYEKIFGCKIVLFCLNRNNPEGGLCSIKYRIKIFNTPDTDEDTPYVFLFESMGSVVDKYKYPQYEYIVRGSLKKGKVDKILDNTFTLADDQVLLNNIITTYKSLFPVEDFSLKFKNKIVHQKFDYNGFIRILLFQNGLSCLVDPIFSLNIKYKELVSNYTISPDLHTFDNVYNFMKSEKLKNIEKYVINEKVYGLIGYKRINASKYIKIYIPICSGEVTEDISEYSLTRNSICPKNLVCSNTDIINDERNSYIQKYIYMSQLSRCLIANIFFLFSIKYKTQSDINLENFEELKTIMSDSFVIDEMFYRNTISLSRYLSTESILFNNNKLKVPSRECIEKLIYTLYIKLRQNRDMVINYSDNKYITNFYEDIRDFTVDINFLLLNNSSLVLFYNYETPKYTLHYNIPPNEDIFYIQNPQIENNEKLLVTKTNSFEQALVVYHNWDSYLINSETKLDDYNYDEDNKSIKLYVFDGNSIEEQYIGEYDKDYHKEYITLGVSKEGENVRYYSFMKI